MRVDRCFAFVDLNDFTAFTERNGDERTVVFLAAFRTRVREIAARRGVRVTKWLGDGAMLSSPDSAAVVAMVLELNCVKERSFPLELSSGLAQGPVIMFEGDDYIGRPANVASRLCDLAAPGEVLATREVASVAPRWVDRGRPQPVQVQGIARPIDACQLSVAKSQDSVVDPCCGLILPDMPGLDTRFGADGTVLRFCSTACALTWEQRQRDDPRPVAAPAAP